MLQCRVNTYMHDRLKSLFHCCYSMKIRQRGKRVEGSPCLVHPYVSNIHQATDEHHIVAKV